MYPSHEFIPVTIDKSHIITIGEKLYAESIEFVRELVNNAYDADATLVEIIVAEDMIEIREAAWMLKDLNSILISARSRSFILQSRQYTAGTGLASSASANLQALLRASGLRCLQRKESLLVGLSLIRKSGRRHPIYGSYRLRYSLLSSGSRMELLL